MWFLACLCVLLSFVEEVSGTCPSQCTCAYHGRNDGSGSRVAHGNARGNCWFSGEAVLKCVIQRSVLCNDPDMNEVPMNFPVDTMKLSIEKTAIHSIPAEAFYYLVELQYLWLTYNSVASIDLSSFYNLKQLHELRLDGNSLTIFPWVSLLDLPRLRTLDLHNNRITSVPNEAARYLKNLTYLDLSSNRLATLPSDFLDGWSHLAMTPSRRLDLSPRRIILGLQDNPWFCDCHISKVIELSKVADPVVVLLDLLMVCSEPEHLAGILFQRVVLERCLKPSVMTSATQITSSLGSNVLLRCDAAGYPTPQLTWTRADGSVNYTVIQESPREGVRWSVLSVTSISYKDAGDYKCKAQNLAGVSEAVVTVTVAGVVPTPTSSDTSQRSPGEHLEPERHPGPGRPSPLPGRPSPPEFSSSSSVVSSASVSTPTSPPPSTASFSLSPFFSIVSSTSLLRTSMSAGTIRTSFPSLQLHQRGKSDAKVNGSKFPPVSASTKEELVWLGQAAPVEMNFTIEDLRVAGETEVSVTLTWNTVNTTSESMVTVLYSKYGEKDLLLLNVDSTKNQVTIDGLEPGRQYVACVCPKGMAPQKDQCITFSTDRAERNSQWSFLVVVTSSACVVVLPLICFLLYKVCKLQCTSESFWEDDLAKETYIRFETLSPRSQSVGELWTRRHNDDAEKQLLCSRSSVESQVNFKIEGYRPEYYC